MAVSAEVARSDTHGLHSRQGAKDSLWSRVLFVVFGIPYLLFLLEQFFLSPRVRIPAPMFSWPLILYGYFSPSAKNRATLLPGWAQWVAFIIALTILDSAKNGVAYTISFLSATLFFRVYVGHNQDRWNRAITTFYGLLILSGITLLLGVLIEPSVSLRIRSLLYVYLVEETDQIALGLTSLVHSFGYHAAALGAASCTLLFLPKPTRYYKVVAPISFVIGLLTLFWGMQRSAVGSALIATIFCLIRRLKAREIAIVTVVAVIVFGMTSPSVVELVYDQPNVYEKHVTDTDMPYRLEIQLEAIELIFLYPLGHLLAGYSWDEMVLTHGGTLSAWKISPHNSYLQVFLQFGIPVGLLMIYGLWKMTQRIWWILGKHRSLDKKTVALGILSCASLVAIISNATLHNSSLFTADGPTVFFYVAVSHLFDMLKKREREQPA